MCQPGSRCAVDSEFPRLSERRGSSHLLTQHSPLLNSLPACLTGPQTLLTAGRGLHRGACPQLVWLQAGPDSCQERAGTRPWRPTPAPEMFLPPSIFPCGQISSWKQPGQTQTTKTTYAATIRTAPGLGINNFLN